MKLIDALEILKQPVPDEAPELKVYLACGFTPLHLQTFLAAQLRIRFPRRRVGITTGLFGDLTGNIERLEPSGVHALAVVIEWGDLDPRLGIRRLGGWRPSNLPDIAESAEQAAARLQRVLLKVSRLVPTVVCTPTLPLPPLFWTPPDRAAPFELHLHQTVSSLAASLSEQPGIQMANAQVLGEISPPNQRFDPKSDVITGFPYSLPHASTLAELLVRRIEDRPPKKGLITDLDDTLWAGILGEDGVNGISWHLEHQTHMHGLYQQFAASLAGAGVLIGVASKNDPALVERALAHSDLLLAKDAFVPIEVGWGRKSEAVGRILKVWNIAPEAVVFIDDSEMEVAEVQAVYPAMDCRVFPKDDPSAVWDLIGELRDLFGRSSISEEDLLRSATIRSNVEQRDELNGQGKSVADFLRKADALITFVYKVGPQDDRPLELINKTHQFNLNGRRLQEAQWRELLSNPQTVVMVVGYKDRFGPLGRISVLLGRCAGNRMEVMYWVLSCRAFSRQIEHACLAQLFRKTGVEEIHFAFAVTDKNGPLREFLGYIAGENLKADFVLTRERFQNMCPELFHREEVVV